MRGVRGSSRPIALLVLVVVGVVLAAALVIPRLPRPIAGVATLDECLWGWPIVAFEGDEWKAAMPDDLGADAQRMIPVASWPNGMRFDEPSGTLLDEHGTAVFRRGDRVRLTGTIIRTSGDPAPCFYTVGIQIETIAVP